MKNSAFQTLWSNTLKNPPSEQEISERLAEVKDFHNLLDKYINKGSNVKVLEVGCGTAVDSYCLAERHTCASFFAFDISPEAICLAKSISAKFNSHIRFSLGDVMEIPFKDNSFDVVFSQGVLEHFKNPLTVLKEQMRVLKKGAYLIVAVPQRYNLYTLYKAQSMMRGRWGYGWETSFSLSRLKKLGKKIGLGYVEAIGWGYKVTWLGHKKHFLYKIFCKWYEGTLRFLSKLLKYNICHLLRDVTVVFEVKR